MADPLRVMASEALSSTSCAIFMFCARAGDALGHESHWEQPLQRMRACVRARVRVVSHACESGRGCYMAHASAARREAWCCGPAGGSRAHPACGAAGERLRPLVDALAATDLFEERAAYANTFCGLHDAGRAVSVTHPHGT